MDGWIGFAQSWNLLIAIVWTAMFYFVRHIFLSSAGYVINDLRGNITRKKMEQSCYNLIYWNVKTIISILTEQLITHFFRFFLHGIFWDFENWQFYKVVRLLLGFCFLTLFRTFCELVQNEEFRVTFNFFQLFKIYYSCVGIQDGTLRPIIFRPKSWYPSHLMNKVFRYQKFLETPKSLPTKFFGTLRQRFFLWYPLHALLKFLRPTDGQRRLWDVLALFGTFPAAVIFVSRFWFFKFLCQAISSQLSIIFHEERYSVMVFWQFFSFPKMKSPLSGRYIFWNLVFCNFVMQFKHFDWRTNEYWNRLMSSFILFTLAQGSVIS